PYYMAIVKNQLSASSASIPVLSVKLFFGDQEDKKKIVTILYLMAEICNKHVNNFKLEFALHLAGSGVTCNAINTLSSAGISVIHQTIYNYKKKNANEHSIRDNNLNDNDKQEDTKDDDSEEMIIDQLNRQETLELDLFHRINKIDNW
ncbi:8029_t:CDS:2, partial [Cetraspora pellucida]